MKARIRICTHTTCCRRGSRALYAPLKRAMPEADIATTDDCFRWCDSGPNVAVNGTLLHAVTQGTVVAQVQKALSEKGVKKDAIGTRSIDELDDALDELTRI